jgi:hypothetical protein
MMNKPVVIWIFFLLNGTTCIYAQWAEQDSVWLQRIIIGNDTLRLNPEAEKAIREGRLINHETSEPQLLEAPPILPLIIDFSGVGTPDSEAQQIDYSTMPPAVLLRNQLLQHADSSLIIDSGAFALPGIIIPKEKIQLGNSPVSVAVGAQNLFPEEVRNGPREGSVGITIGATFSLQDVLLYIFSKKERQKRKNRKRAEQLKY